MILTEKHQKYQHYHLGKIDKYEYLTGEEILPSKQRKIIEEATITHKIFETNSIFQVK